MTLDEFRPMCLEHSGFRQRLEDVEKTQGRIEMELGNWRRVAWWVVILVLCAAAGGSAGGDFLRALANAITTKGL